MAGEWIAVDIALPDKPEVQELIDATGEPVEVVVFRLYRLWAWASMHCADGTARMTIPRLVRTCGGDAAFWQAVKAVGWLELDETAATVAVPGWDRRFSQAAKARLQHRDRASAQEEGRGRLRSSAGAPCAPAQGQPAPARRRGEECRSTSSSAREEPEDEAAAWAILRAAWNSGDPKSTRRRPWKPSQPPSGVQAATGTPEALAASLEAVERLPSCRYFSEPVPLTQFLGSGFILRVLGGQYDTAKQARRSDDGPAPPRVDAAFEASRRATEAREAARRAAEHRRLDEQAIAAEGVA